VILLSQKRNLKNSSSSKKLKQFKKYSWYSDLLLGHSLDVNYHNLPIEILYNIYKFFVKPCFLKETLSEFP